MSSTVHSWLQGHLPPSLRFHCHTTFLCFYPTTSCQDPVMTLGPPSWSRVISSSTHRELNDPAWEVLIATLSSADDNTDSRVCGMSSAEDMGKMPSLKHGACKKSKVWGMLPSKHTVLPRFPQHCRRKHSEICHFFTLGGITKRSVSCWMNRGIKGSVWLLAGHRSREKLSFFFY